MGGFEPVKKWILNVEQGGDTVLEYAVHWFDLANWIMGTHPVKAVGLGGQSLHFDERFDREIMDNYKVFLEYPGKRKLFYAQTSVSVPGLDPMEDIVYGTKGVFDLNANKLCKRMPAEAPRPQAIVTEDPKDDVDESLWDYRCCQDFFEAHRTGVKPFTDFEVGKTTILTALLARKAIYEKRVVTWDELLREGAPLKRLDQ